MEELVLAMEGPALAQLIIFGFLLQQEEAAPAILVKHICQAVPALPVQQGLLELMGREAVYARRRAFG
jgi:hypothetical protein